MNSSIIIGLELGDIIEIYSPNNVDYHENAYIIQYIDEMLIDMVNINDGSSKILTLEENGKLTDESIESIYLISRNENEGYAKQNGLNVGKWINIHFGGDYPTIIVGQITNNEKDMIEITTYPELQTIYIDFGYKGVPRDIPITTIEIREPPQQYSEKTTLDEIKNAEENKKYTEADLDTEFEDGESLDGEDDVSIDKLQELYNETSEIIFGKELEQIQQVVEVPEKERKYDIEVQLNDLLDEFLSTIPNEKRTPTIMNNIQLLITRFKELRERFSIFSDSSSHISPKIRGHMYKPLIETLSNVNTKLKWLIPVVKQNKFVTNNLDEGVAIDVIHEDSTEIHFENLTAAQDQYSGSVKYNHDLMNNTIADAFKPFENANDINTLKVLTVNANIEAINDSLSNFDSSIINEKIIENRKYVIEQYNLGLQKINVSTFNKTNVVLRNTPNDKLSVSSYLMMPFQYINQSKLYLQKENILQRVKQHQNLLTYFQFLNKHTDVVYNMIDSLSEEFDYNNIDLTKANTFFLNSMNINIEDEEKYEKFLETIIPKSKKFVELMRKFIEKKYSFVSIVDELEPFCISKEDVTYTLKHNTIRYQIKENIKNFKKTMMENSVLFSGYANNRLLNNNTKPMHLFDKLLDEETKTIMENYKLNKMGFNHELLRKIYDIDDSKLLYLLLSKMMFVLNIPDKMNITDESENHLKIKTDCSRRFLSKKYESLEELTKDNNKDTIYYDKEYDDTPYEMMDMYKTEKQNMTSEDFYEFLKEALIQKHDVQKDYVDKLAKTLIEGKKQIENDDYALFIETSEEDERGIDRYYRYYKRIKDNWVRDESMNDTVFMDNNTLFCNIQSKCFKNTENQMCQSKEQMNQVLQQMRKDELLNELETRYNVNMDDLEKELESKLIEYERFLRKYQIVEYVGEQKANNLAYQLGIYAKTDITLKSPHQDLFQKILSSSDFSTKQENIIKFVNMFCREPIVDSDETLFWKYCKDSNVKLVPSFLYELAESFFIGQYEYKLYEIIRKQGVESDDGEAIVDQYSGMVITKRSFDAEEGYDEKGFKVSSREMLDQEITQIPSERKMTVKERKIFENPHMEKIYKVFTFLTNSMDIDSTSISELCLRISLELVDTKIKTKESYEKLVEKQKQKNPDKKMSKFEDYFNESLIMIVSGCFLTSIQINIPSLTAKKTFPGCAKSFSGYPIDGDEDNSGLHYISCVLYKTRTDVEPWSAVKKYGSIDKFEKNIRSVIDKYLLQHTDILYHIKQKKQYLLLHPEEKQINELHSIKKWTSYLPPLVKYTINSANLDNVSKEFIKELLVTINNGKSEQQQMYLNMISKNMMFTYGMIELINAEVQKEIPVLKTFGGIPFVDNACCQDNTRPMQYFINKNNSISIYLNNIIQNDKTISTIKELSKAPLFYHSMNNRNIVPIMPVGHSEENIYAYIIHHCNFDKVENSLKEYQSICGEVPKSYNKDYNLEEKIAVLKRNGKNYDIKSMFNLMKLVNGKNINKTTITSEYDFVPSLSQMLTDLESKENPIFEKPLLILLQRVIEEYNKNELKIDSTENLDNLKNYLLMTIGKMHVVVDNFIKQYCNLKRSEYNNINSFLLSLKDGNDWESSLQNNFHKTNYLVNFVYYITKLVPQLLCSGKNFATVHKHWNLSDSHNNDLKKIIMDEFVYLKDVDINIHEKNSTMYVYLTRIQETIHEIYTLCNLIPYDDYGDNYSFMDKRCQELFLTYCIFSTLYEYIILTDNEDMIQIEVEYQKSSIRKRNREQNTNSDALTSSNELQEEYADNMLDLEEIEINTGVLQTMKKNVGKILTAILKTKRQEKNMINYSYDGIINKTRRSKDYEKKQIIKYLGKMSIELRKIEDTHKQYKLGMWNAGLQKGMINYDKNTYDNEMKKINREIIQGIDREVAQDEDIGEGAIAMSMIQNVYGVEDLEKHDEELNEQMYDNEAQDISHLGEDYYDGNYYPEDNEE